MVHALQRQASINSKRLSRLFVIKLPETKAAELRSY